ncbi:tyrosine-protein phosphatase [Streptomyces sp. NPDC000410]|uniref:tyrosine-protein phosphatase n=1 Tax=Streptomyces sp. NPDC000410 TaxID=3154254 RepID=UPI003332C2F7
MPLTRRALLSTATAAAFVAVAAPANAASRRTRGSIRHIPLTGAVNVRDLGGYRTYDGEEVRYGRIYRADALSKLTEADVAVLAGLGLTAAIDFRIPIEIQYDGADKLPAGVTPVARPITDNGLYAQMMAAIGSRDPVKQEEMLGGGRAATFMRNIYPSFVTSAANRAQFAATLRDAAAPGRTPLLYHCTSGKDRTGWTSYLLLVALGVPAPVAVQDYLASNTFRAAHDAKVREGLKQSGMMQNPDLIIPLQEVRTEYLNAALSAVDTEYGSLYRYLTVGLGLDLQTLAALRSRLVH